MLIHERLSRIRQILAHNPRCPVDEIQQELGVSRSTVRRDLMKLEARGDVLRVHGGVVNPGLLRGEPSYERRSHEAVAAKRAIGRIAANLIDDGQSVFVDAGTTCVEAGRRLLLRENIRIFTNSLRLLQLAIDGVAEVISLGGVVRRPTEALVGALTQAWCEHLRFDVALIGASALSIEEGAHTTELSESAVKQHAMRRADRSILLADSGKLAATAPVTFTTWSKFDVWVLEHPPPREMGKRLRGKGVKLTFPEATRK